MVTKLVADVSPSISRDRLEAYRPRGGTDLEMVTNYLYNLAVSESLYAPMAVLEVTLRNSLATVIGDFYGTPTWYDLRGVLEPYQARDIANAKHRLQAAKTAATPGRVVAELTFGFWNSLLSSAYDNRLWRPNRAELLKQAFPSIPKRLRQRGPIYNRFYGLRELRNRVFHHEPIWNRPTLAQDHADIYQAIDWINPAMIAPTRLVDRFPDVLAHGRTKVETDLTHLLGLP